MNIITPDWPAPAEIRAFTTTRPYWGKNIGNVDAILQQESARLTALMALPSEPVWLNQTHSDIAVCANTHTDPYQAADASYTDKPNQICVVLTADCLPILLCNAKANRVAAIHAGWRGLANGVVENTVQALKSGQNDSDWLAWLGPAIGPEKFEVGADVYHAFTEQDAESKRCFVPGAPEKWLANLYDLATLRLQKLGITHIYGGEYCTHSDPDLFFSWRRDRLKTGRMASLIWIEKK
jgi:YfiH family protein